MDRNIIFERLSGRLYHFTSLDGLLKIIDNEWTFKLSSSDSEEEENIRHGKKYFISFTRQKDYRIGFPAAVYNSAYDSIVVRIEFNGDLLNNNFEGYAIDYFKGAKHNYFKQRRVNKIQCDNESEDRLFSNKPIIKGIDKYITRIDILCLDEEDFEEWSSELSSLLRKSDRIYIYNNGNDFIKQNNNTINKFLINNMVKVQISENDLKSIIEESVKRIINEHGIYDSEDDNDNKYMAIDYDDLSYILKAHGWSYYNSSEFVGRSGKEYVRFDISKDSSRASDIETVMDAIKKSSSMPNGIHLANGKYTQAPELKRYTIYVELTNTQQMELPGFN